MCLISLYCCEPGIVLSTLRGRCNIVPGIQMREWRHRDTVKLAQGCTAHLDSNPELSFSAKVLNCSTIWQAVSMSLLKTLFIRFFPVLEEIHPHIPAKGSETLLLKIWPKWKWKVVAWACLTLCDPMDVAYQDLLSMGFSRQEYWSGLPFPSPGDLPNPGSNLGLPHCRQMLKCLSHQGSTKTCMAQLSQMVMTGSGPQFSRTSPLSSYDASK